MTKFIKTLIIFIFPLLIASYGIDVIISKNLQKSNKYPGNYSTWNAIYNHSIDSDIVIYGSSRATHHIDPKIIEDSVDLKVYNFGVNGHNFWIQYLKHLEYLKHNRPPKHIFMCLDYNTLEKIKKLYQLDQFLPYMLWNANIKKYTKSYEGFTILDYYVPAVRYFGREESKIKTIEFALKGKNLQPYKFKGYKGLDIGWNDDLARARKEIGSYVVNIDQASVKLFDKFLMECKNNSIEVTLIFTPVFIEGQKFVSNREVAFDLYKKYSEKYELHFIDYSNDSICLNRNYFTNSTHLNQRGAEIFTSKLVQDLKELEVLE